MVEIFIAVKRVPYFFFYFTIEFVTMYSRTLPLLLKKLKDFQFLQKDRDRDCRKGKNQELKLVKKEAIVSN